MTYLRRLHPPALFLAAVVLVAVGSGAVLAVAGSGGWPPALDWLSPAAAVILGRWPIEVDSRSDGVVVGLDPAVLVFLAFWLPARPAALLWLVGAGAVHLSARKNLWARVFNVACAFTAGVAALAVISAVSGPQPDGAAAVAAAVLGGSVYLSVDLTLSSAATLVVDRMPLRSVLLPPDLPIAAGCFGCVVALGYLTAVVGSDTPWSTVIVLLPLGALLAAARAVRRTSADRTRSVALFGLSSAAQRATSEEQVLEALARHGADALRCPWVTVQNEGGAAACLSVALPALEAGERRILVAGARMTGEPWDDGDRRGAVLLASLVAEAFQRLRLLGELDQMATHDPLTGLLNRAAWERRFSELLDGAAGQDGGRPVSVLFCDLDQFKAVNDRYGHAVGDAVLAAVGARLAGALRPGDLAARLGGDEFALAVLGPSAPVVERLRHVLAEPVAAAGVEVVVSASIGSVLVDPDAEVPHPDQLLSQADADMYAAKRSGRGGAVVAG